MDWWQAYPLDSGFNTGLKTGLDVGELLRSLDLFLCELSIRKSSAVKGLALNIPRRLGLISYNFLRGEQGRGCGTG
jgi:hypothetical protein